MISALSYTNPLNPEQLLNVHNHWKEDSDWNEWKQALKHWMQHNMEQLWRYDTAC